VTTAVFQASDLAGAKRREFLGAARKGGALLRDTDGFALTMVPLSQLEAVTEVARTAVAALLAAAALSRGPAFGAATHSTARITSGSSGQLSASLNAHVATSGTAAQDSANRPTPTRKAESRRTEQAGTRSWGIPSWPR